MSHNLPEKRSALYACEEQVEKGVGSASKALLRIKREELWREAVDANDKKYPTWKAYVAGRWGPSKPIRSIWRALAHAEVLENVGECPNGSLPNERQARELAPLDPESQAAVWQASEGKLTAAELQRIKESAQAAIPADQREAMVREAEEKAAAKARLRDTRTIGGEGWPETLNQIERLVSRLRKLTERRGPECDNALPHLDAYLNVVQGWD